MKKSQVAWEWSRGVNPVRRRLTHSPKRSLFQFTLHCPVSFWQKQPSEKCYSTLVWKLNVSMQNIGVAINSCLHFVKFVQVCHFSPLHVVWFTRIWGINSCEYFFMQICERLWICPIHSSVKLNWRPKTVCTLHHYIIQWNIKITTASGILLYPKTLAMFSGKVEAFCLLSTHPECMLWPRPVWREGQRVAAASVATDKDESNNIRLSYKGTAGHIPKELV